MRRWICLFAMGWLAGFGCVLAADAPSDASSLFEGVWLGKVTAPNGTTEIGFAFKRSPQGLIVSFYMPAMGIDEAVLGPAEIAGDTFSLPPLDTSLTRKDDKLVGTFAIRHLPVELKKVRKWPAVSAPREVPAGPASLWKVSLGSETWASPVVRGEFLYLGTVDGKFHARAVSDGHEVWTWTGPNALYGTALVTEAAVYVVDTKSELVCLSRTNGTPKWRRPLFDEQAAGGAFVENPTFNHRTPTPILLEGLVYVGSADGGLYAIDPTTGEVRARHQLGIKIFGPAGVDGKTLLVGGLDGTVVAFDTESGKEMRRTKLPGGVVSAPVVVGDTVIVGCRDYLLYGLRRSDLSIAWRDSFWFSWVESTPAIVDGIAYIGGSDYARISALDPASGAAKWVTRVYGLTWGTPIVTRDTVFAGAHAQKTALIAHVGSIVALDRRTGAMRWRIPLPNSAGAERSGVLGSLALAGDRLIAVAFDGNLAAYPAK